jgi:anhydro-N-acetylmuramic acid kinase
MKKTYHVIGLMSGSSLDGLDIALCRFDAERKGREFFLAAWELLRAETTSFSETWQKRLRELPFVSGFELAEAHADFGRYMGELVQLFFAKHNLKSDQIDLIASHGHTIFHEPAKGFTVQIGDGASMATITGCKVACDFRSSDVSLGGQGAPLAPISDKMLFPGFDFYLNIGGIANVTCLAERTFIAFDVTGANQVLNTLANLVGQSYDHDGHLAANGLLDEFLFEQLNSLPYLESPYPKSLSNQWVQENMVKPCLQAKSSVQDRLHTVCRHIALQLKKSMLQIIEHEHFAKEKYQMLATGGGVFNNFLMQCIREESPGVEVVIPTGSVVSFKEACLMALLGLLRVEELPNCISSVTGASRDAVGGAIYCSRQKS